MTLDSDEGSTILPIIGSTRESNNELGRVIAISQPDEPSESSGLSDNPDTAANHRTLGQGITEFCKTSEAGFALNKAAPTQPSRFRRESQEVPEESSRVPLKPVNNQISALKIGNSIGKEAVSKKQTVPVTGKRNVQLNEDELFEQLILRMRQREESEQNAANIQRQMETENHDLKETNHTLQDRVKKYQVQLVKLSSETRHQRAQIDQWKARLGTFRGVLNEIGREYDKVREQTKDLKENAVSLGREKGEIQSTLDDLKIQVSKHAATVEDQREKLSTSEGTVVILREALEHSEKRGDLIKGQLVSDKKRIATLENYIHKESQSQARYLTVVRKEQTKMADKLDSICEMLSKSCSETPNTIISKLRPEIQHCVASVEELKKQCFAEAMNVESFNSTVQEAASRYVVYSPFYISLKLMIPLDSNP
jgi:DNA repair exonuclease SbcCD ATPase subunit